MPTTTHCGLTAMPEDEFKIWDCIAVTCSSPMWAKAVESELALLQTQNKIHKDTIVLAVEDPTEHLGSGGATLNALLVIAEKLCAKFKYQVISSDILIGKRILILHQGRSYPFDVCSKAFITLPCENHDTNDVFSSSLTTNMEHIINVVNNLQKGCWPEGLWVCSTDMVLLMSASERLDFSEKPDGIMLCVPASIDWAVNHGSVIIDQQGYVETMLYGATEKELKKYESGDLIPLAAGIVYLSTAVAETLLSFHEMSPLDCCTYMGLDSGANYLRVSLFFDILLAMSTGLSREEFMSENCGKSYNKRHRYDHDKEAEQLIHIGRIKVWESLNRFKLRAALIETGYHNYWNEEWTARDHINTLKSITTAGCHHSINEGEVDQQSLIINSSLSDGCEIGRDSVVQHSAIRGRFIVGERCFLSSANISLVDDVEFKLGDDLCLIVFPVRVQFCDTLPTCFQVLIGTDDYLSKRTVNDPSSTYLNVSWVNFMRRTGISDEDLWPDHIQKKDRCLLNARLFPVMQNLHFLTWFQTGIDDDRQLLERWKVEPRFSLSEIIKNLDATCALQYRRDIYGNITCEIVRQVLLNDQEVALWPYFNIASSQRWSGKLLACLDAIAIEVSEFDSSSGNLKRIFFCIADLLGFMGGNEAGIRSGPAGNRLWDSAFMSIEAGEINEAVKLLAEKRTMWVDKPEQMLRAARHYEKAALMIIKQDVSTVRQHVDLKCDHCLRTNIDVWVKAECPVRADLFGAWTDTPPQCYELQGHVIDISFQLEGQKPIGAQARRIGPLKIVLVLHGDSMQKQFVYENLDDVMDYIRPNAPASLLKASIICAGILDVTCNQSLQTQLQKRLGSGLELHTWSRVPQGSGLGTSSILAGAITAVLWTLLGKVYTRVDLFHMVLMIEQLLTTGGGWQDTVGGIMGGLSNGFSKHGLPLKVDADLIDMTPESIRLFERHVYLIHTGKVRLARNILQNTIRNWYARESSVVSSFKEMLSSIPSIIKALLEGNLELVGKCINRYWELKKIVAPGCEPHLVKALMEKLRPFAHGQLLTGAGGGGFLCLISKFPDCSDNINEILKEFPNAKLYESSLDMEGIVVTVDDKRVQVPYK